jgi:hypothetical protein
VLPVDLPPAGTQKWLGFEPRRQGRRVVKDAAAFAGLALDFFSTFGSYLRVFLARPEYLCAMKLKALQRETLDDRDFQDAVRLAKEIGVSSEGQLRDLHAAFYPGETLDPAAAARLPAIVSALRRPS